jgi:STE24 endopeptidase
MWIYPNFIQPLFNKFEPLHDDELRTKIEDLAGEEEFPLTNLYQIDGSKRSSHSNAYFFGFWKNKRIVIFDTLLTLSHDQILAVLCHELGHWKFGHINGNLAITSAHLFLMFWSFGKVMYSGDTSKAIMRSFGFGDSNAVMLSLMTFQMLITPVEQVLSLLMTLRTRANEFQADSFAVQKGRGRELSTGLLQMSQENKGDLNPDWLYAWYHFSHPALVERLRAIEECEKKSK